MSKNPLHYSHRNNAMQHLERNMITKSENRELTKLTQWRDAGYADAGLLARSLSALIRAARTNKSAAYLRAVAAEWRVTDHPEFIA